MAPFSPGEELSLPALARAQGFETDAFTVVDVAVGGVGACARIRQAASGPTFALKALPPASGKEDLERVLRELQVWVTLSVCDGIVEALCVFPLKELPAVCSKWMAGGSLRTRMSTRDPELFYRTLLRVAGTLEWAHANHGVVHRDLKPENILLDGLGHAAVGDWGIPAPPGESALEKAPGGGPPAHGTAAYTSPEQLRGGAPPDPRSDIYSLGCLMYEWETGKKPFSGTPRAIREAKTRGEAPKIASGLLRRTTFGAEDVIARCLQRERNDRHPDWKTLVADLVKAAARRGIPVTPFVPKMRDQGASRVAGALRMRASDLAAVPVRGGEVRAPVEERGPARDLDEAKKVPVRGGEARAPVAERGPARDLDEAKKLAGAGDWEAAVGLLSRVVLPAVAGAPPDDPVLQSAALALARGLLNLGRPAEAVTALDALSGATGKPAELFASLAEAHLALGHAPLAERAARAGLTVQPGTALFEHLVKAQVAQGLFADAVATARQRLGVSRDAASLSAAGEQLVEQAARVSEARLPEKYEFLHEAVAFLTEARERAPQDAVWRLPLALALAALDRWTEARVLLEISPEPRDARRAREAAELLARCLLRLREYAACLAQCNRSLALFPDSVDLARKRALAFIEGFVLGVEAGGRRVTDDASMSFFERIVTHPERREPVDFVTLARYREWTGRAEEGAALLTTGRKAFPQSWEIAAVHARFLERRGAFEEALAAAQEAARLAPFRPEGWAAVAAIRGLLGPKEEADDARRKAQQADGRLRSLRTPPPVK